MAVLENHLPLLWRAASYKHDHCQAQTTYILRSRGSMTLIDNLVRSRFPAQGLFEGQSGRHLSCSPENATLKQFATVNSHEMQNSSAHDEMILQNF